MKKETKNIFNQSYHQHESEVDAEAIWRAVEPKKGKRRPFIFWMFGSLLILSIISYLLLSQGLKSKTNQLENSTRLEESIKNSSKKNEMLSSTYVNEIPQQSNLVKAEGRSSKIKNENSSNPENKISNSSLIEVKKNEVPQMNRTQENFVNTENFRSTSIVENTKADFEKSQKPIKNRTSLNDAESSILSFEVINRLEFLTKKLFELDDSRKRMICYLDLSPIEQYNAVAKLDEENDQLGKDQLTGKFAITTLATAGLFGDKYSASSNADYQMIRASSESPLESLGANLNIAYEINRIRIGVGINYLRSNRVVNWSKKYFGDSEGRLINDYDPTAIDPDLLKNNQDSADVFLYDRTLRKYNETHTVSVPVSIGYLQSFDKFSIGIWGGAAIHLIQKHNSDVLNTDFKIQDQRLISDAIKLRPDLISGLTFGYNMTENISLISQLEYRYRITEEPLLTRKSSFYSLGLGIQYVW